MHAIVSKRDTVQLEHHSGCEGFDLEYRLLMPDGSVKYVRLWPMFYTMNR